VREDCYCREMSPSRKGGVRCRKPDVAKERKGRRCSDRKRGHFLLLKKKTMALKGREKRLR